MMISCGVSCGIRLILNLRLSLQKLIRVMLDDLDVFEGWQSDAVCRNHDHPHWWISDNYIEVENAKALCGECEVNIPCLISAISGEDASTISLPPMGVYAGMSRLDMLMCAWKRIDDVSESNWSGPDKIVEAVIKREG